MYRSHPHKTLKFWIKLYYTPIIENLRNEEPKKVNQPSLSKNVNLLAEKCCILVEACSKVFMFAGKRYYLLSFKTCFKTMHEARND
jgi:hypothetical protein